MRYFIVALITFYQRFISPYKGFKCAHNAMYKQGSCSHIVKELVEQYGVLTALPMVRVRLKECGNAYSYLKVNRSPFNQELACDLPCDLDIGGCADIGSCGDFSGGRSGESSCDMFGACDVLPDWRDFSRRTKKLIITFLLLAILVASYLFYGRGIDSIYIVDKGEQSQSLLARLTQRGKPEVRLLLVVNGEKTYSNILLIEKENTEYRFTLERSFSHTNFDRIEVLDARLNIAKELVVIGQVLETFEQPETKGHGVRFDYRIKRRWHFF